MKKISLVIITAIILSGYSALAGVTLLAITHKGEAAITLQWNMMNYPGNTAYTLFKSEDGVNWKITAANPVFRNYTSSTVLGFRDNFAEEKQLYYRVKIYDVNENIVAVSNTAVAANPKMNYSVESPVVSKSKTSIPNIIKGNVWQINPNPAGGMLNLYYRGNDIIKGVINVIIQDVTGKVVLKFRAASVNKQLHIDVSNLHAAFYFIRINVFNEVQLNEKFIKQ